MILRPIQRLSAFHPSLETLTLRSYGRSQLAGLRPPISSSSLYTSFPLCTQRRAPFF